MREAVCRVGPCSLQLEPDGFRMLVRSITSQQISTAAARTIAGRLRARTGPDGLEPQAVREIGVDGLRSCGYSGRKASYLLGIADVILEGSLDLPKLHALSDEQVVERLVKLRGVGEWTAHMYLIFSMGRPDVFPHGDLGVRNALRRFHSLEALPAKREAIELAKPWRPFASVASWYCWRTLDVDGVAGNA